MKARNLLGLCFPALGASVSICVQGMMGPAPWAYGVLLALALVQLGLLVALQVALSDQLLAQYLGVDAIIRDGHAAQVLVVVPNSHEQDTSG